MCELHPLVIKLLEFDNDDIETFRDSSADTMLSVRATKLEKILQVQLSCKA